MICFAASTLSWNCAFLPVIDYINSFPAFSWKLMVFTDPAQASRDGKQIEGIHGVYTMCWCRCLQTVNVWGWKPSGVSLWHYMKCSARPLCACMCDWNPVELIRDSLVMSSNSRLAYLNQKWKNIHDVSERCISSNMRKQTPPHALCLYRIDEFTYKASEASWNWKKRVTVDSNKLTKSQLQLLFAVSIATDTICVCVNGLSL